MILKVKDWKSTAMDRDAWRLLVQEAKVHNGLYSELVVMVVCVQEVFYLTIGNAILVC
jgi:hypothetical protein